ncbi:glycosyltransferase family 2 protein [uncultured Sanguibacteroides sp.]|uniref:glycosyltransferase family 2 protein n=1 Tax=uncultured Sanguibacteroides sp. TaxID=1635151 RepID=UPI0025EE7698|nr:glycosyltransferase family 2 protein [uncultured Sanguibacteroides sp.]
MNNQLNISIITVNYNGMRDTCELIESLHRYVSVSHEIIVVDNGSKSNEASLLQEKYPWIVTIRSQHNLGFAGGNNLGIRQAKGKYIFLLNNDTYVTEDTFGFLLEAIEKKKEIGAVSPKIKFAFPPQNIQFAGYTPLSRISLRNQLIGFGQPDKDIYNRAIPTPFLHGAALLFKREILEKVGYLPDIYFLYYEELDWCTQITRHGYELWYEPRCTVFHKESQSTGQNSPLRTFYLTRNRLLYAWRNRKGGYRLLAILYQLFIAAPKNTVIYLLHGRLKLIHATGKGIAAFFTLKHKLA